MTDFVSNVEDYGDAPEIFVTGVSRVTRISKGVVRITLYATREVAEGKTESRVVDVLNVVDRAVPMSVHPRRTPSAAH